MTQGIVSVRKDGTMLYKIVVGHNGMYAPKVASMIRDFVDIPSVETIQKICADAEFGCPDCVIILEHDPDNWNHPKLHAGKDIDWDESSPECQRYYDTFHVEQFNPRWKYGTADYVEVVDLYTKQKESTLHLWSDEEVAEMKAKGQISTENVPSEIGDLDIPF